MRKDAVLSKLTEAQQADLFDWLCTETFEAVRARVAKAPPDGFGIKTHVNSLARFFRARQLEVQTADFAEAAAAPEASAAPSIEAAVKASNRAFVHATFVLAHSPLNPANYRALSRVLQRNEINAVKREFLEVARQHVALAREKLNLERRQFEYNAARVALSLLPELIAIDQMTDIDDEEKIWRVRDRVFGLSGPGPASESK
jgi:hypothetical protein